MDDQSSLRYSRQILLPAVGMSGQKKLLQAKVLIVGMGGLGSPAAMYLAASGVGHLVISDFDQVDLSNLQRQIIHTSDRIGTNKAESAQATLLRLNPDVRVETITEKLPEEAYPEIIRGINTVIDGSDNFKTRFALNRLCLQAKRPLISAAVIGMQGQITAFDFRTEGSPCYGCLYEEGPAGEQQSCAENGVLSPLPGILGSMQAVEAIKMILGFGENLVGRLLLLNAENMVWREVKIKKDPACKVCGSGKETA